MISKNGIPAEQYLPKLPWDGTGGRSGKDAAPTDLRSSTISKSTARVRYRQTCVHLLEDFNNVLQTNETAEPLVMSGSLGESLQIKRVIARLT